MKGRVARLEEHPLLRVYRTGFSRRHTKFSVVKEIGGRKKAPVRDGRHLVGTQRHHIYFGWQRPTSSRHLAHCISARPQHVP
jgi:hypothetical protein